MSAATRLTSIAGLIAAAGLGPAALAQSETLFQTVGADTPRTFVHLSAPGATGIDFSLSVAIAPTYPATESHMLVVVFEWGPSDSGPWSTSPDNVKSVVGGETRFFDTGIYHGPDDAAWVRVHFYAGAIMTVSGTFTHTSVVPEPPPALLLAAGLAVLAWRRRHALGFRDTARAGAWGRAGF